MAQKYCSQQRQDVTECEAGGSCWKTGKWSFIKWLKNWVKICRIIAVLRDCEVKMWRPSGLSSSVILSSAFSSLVLPSTWQGFPLHSWLYNLSLCLSLNHSHSCVCVCVHMHTRMCACLSDSGVHVNLWYVQRFERIYGIIAVTLFQSTKYIKLFDPLTRHWCTIIPQGEEYHSYIHC